MFNFNLTPKNQKILLTALLLLAWIAVIIYALSLPNSEAGPTFRFALVAALVIGIVWRRQLSKIDARAAHPDSPDDES